jgi:hypothetical protein
MRGLPLSLSLLGLPLLLAGCGKGDNRYEITGNVLFKKQPLDNGSIQFLPVAPPDLSPSGAPIQQGKYVVPKSHGLAPGKYKVSISSGEPGTDIRKEMDAEAAGGEPYPIAKERIPPRYNTKTELTIEVKKEGPFTFDFDLMEK